jgi:hypothetical protein
MECDMRNFHKNLLEKPGTPFGKPGYRWKGNATMVLKEMGYEDVDKIRVTENRVR